MTGATENADLYVVLGATGGIGRAVVAEAAARGHRVRALSRSATPHVTCRPASSYTTPTCRPR